MDMCKAWGRNSSVGIAKGYGLDGWGSIRGGGKSSRPALGPTQHLIQWVPGVLHSGVKRPGHEADHLPPSVSEVNNCGAILPLRHTSSSRYALLIKYTDSFTFTCKA
jgi:hypothetical protein